MPPHDVTLFTVARGSGPTVIVLHGGLGLDHAYLLAPLAPLADAARLVFCDLRGNGRSPHGDAPLTIPSLADDVARLIADQGDGPALVLAHSYGSVVAQELALRHPDAVRGLLLCATAPAFDYADHAVGLARARATDDQFAALLELFGGAVADDAALAALWARVLPVYLHDPATTASDPLAGVTFRARAHNEGAAALASLDHLDRVGAIRVPTRVISGESDWIMPPAFGGQRIAERIPGAVHHVLPRCGHFAFTEAREPFLALARAWLAEARAQA